MSENQDPYLSTAVIVGRRHPLTQPLSRELFNVRQKVFSTDVPVLHASAKNAIPPPRADVRAWILWCTTGEFTDSPSDGDLKDRARRIVGSVQMMGASEAVVVTDFSVGEIDHFREQGLQFWRDWEPEEAQSFLSKAGVMRTRLVAYFQLVRQLAERQIPVCIVHCGSITGDSRTGEYEHSPVMETLFDMLWSGKLNFLPGDEDGWLPGVSSDFAATFLARMPQPVADRTKSIWLYDRRGLPMHEVIANAARDLGRPVPSRRVSAQAVKVMEWTGVLRRMGLESAARRLTRKRFDNQLEIGLASEMGLAWPDRREAMRLAADFFLRGKGVDPASVSRPPLERRQERPEKRSGTLAALPRSF